MTVRKTCLECLLDLRKKLNESKSIEQVTEMVLSLVKFGLGSKAPNFTSTIALRLADLCHILLSKRTKIFHHYFSFEVFRIDKREFIREVFIRLSEEKVKHFPKISIRFLHRCFSEYSRMSIGLCETFRRKIKRFSRRLKKKNESLSFLLVRH